MAFLERISIMLVKLLAYTPEPEKTVACAAKLCYASSDIDTLYEGLTEEKVEKFLDHLNNLGHQSPIEHASFTFGIEGVSRSLLAQITRHRIASFSVQSQRYVREAGRAAQDGFQFVLPPEIEKIPEAREEFLRAMEEDARHYESLAALLKEKHKKELMEQGLDEGAALKKAEKMAIEDARFVLPNACATKMLLTMNARSLLNFFSLRCCSRAQWEIRELATQMLKEVKAVAPHLFRDAGPGCVRGACPEGSMSCGRASEMREKFQNL